MRDWRSVALLVVTSLLLGRESALPQPPAPVVVAPLDLGAAVPVRIVSPVPVILVAPVEPNPAPVRPTPPALPEDSVLSRAGRDYLHQIPDALPARWRSIADQVERGTIVDKAGAVKLHGQLSADLNAALDATFAPGVDARGKITDKQAIVVPLRNAAATLEIHH